MTDLDFLKARFLNLERLERAGRAESPEADAIRDQCKVPWYRLTQAEADELQRHSVALQTADIGDAAPSQRET